jgi:1,4-dihydroxy-2-naphthoyl-CoA synthase
MTYTTIVYTVADRIATIALDRPAARNGYTVTMADELHDAFDRADRDQGVRVVIFTGNGSDFCVRPRPASQRISGPASLSEPPAVGHFAIQTGH